MRSLKCLWLTLADPDPPRNGQFLYSSGLIRSVTAAGMELDVVGLSLPGGAHEDAQTKGNIRWHLAPHRPRSARRAVLSRWPRTVYRTQTADLRKRVGALLSAQAWDVVVFDSIDLGWTLLPVLDRYRHESVPPELVYLAHNHEETAARTIARNEAQAVKRIHRYLDALKIRWLERRLARHCTLITANTPEDCRQFRQVWPGKRIEFLPPGYAGVACPERRIDETVPRRAIIVGSFDWVIKRQSLTSFLAAAATPFREAGIALDVVGQADERFLDQLRQSYQSVRFTGRVDDIIAYMRDARIALVPDTAGGFKLKALDYVFNRLPIFAVANSLPGIPLRDGENVAFFGAHRQLAEGVVRAIDDFDYLNALQEMAYRTCCDSFDWDVIGRNLFAAITQTARRRARSGSAETSEAMSS